nr:YbaB/EbfC family nucleoid-associated protein [Clostridia bacterium]
VDPEDVEMLEDLIIAAFNDAIGKADETREQKLGKFAGMGL